MSRIEQAIILAAGEGQRLRPFTVLKPKVMITVANKPVLQYVVEALAANGVRRIILVVGHRKEQVLNFFGNGEQFGVEISYVVQKQQLGTAHALKQARDLAAEEFLVLSGDNIIEPDTIADLVQAKPNAILAKEQPNISKYGVVVERDGTVESIVEKPKEAESNLVNTGIYVLHHSVFDFIGEEVELPAVLSRMIEQEEVIRLFHTEGAWLDIVYPWDILKLNDRALSQVTSCLGGVVESGVAIRGEVAVGKGTKLRSGSYIVGPVIIGENCEIGPGACILPSTSIGDNVVVSPFTLIENSVIGNGVQVGAHSTVQDSIVDRSTVLGGHFVACRGKAAVRADDEYHQIEMGAMVGEHCIIDNSVIAEPGVSLGNYCSIRAMKVLRGNLPDQSMVM